MLLMVCVFLYWWAFIYRVLHLYDVNPEKNMSWMDFSKYTYIHTYSPPGRPKNWRICRPGSSSWRAPPKASTAYWEHVPWPGKYYNEQDTLKAHRRLPSRTGQTQRSPHLLPATPTDLTPVWPLPPGSSPLRAEPARRGRRPAPPRTSQTPTPDAVREESQLCWQGDRTQHRPVRSQSEEQRGSDVCETYSWKSQV